MKKLVSTKLAGNIILAALGMVLIMHTLILVGVIPSNVVWAGSIQGSTELYRMEGISFVITLLFIGIIAAKTGYIKIEKGKKAINIGVWVFFAYMILNSLGNLASGVSAENWFFAPITIVLAILSFRLAIEE